MVPNNFTRLAGIVVHHDRLDVIGSTVNQLLQEGVAPENLVLVDNSDGDVLQEVQASVDDDVIVRQIPNKGYANAVNFGLDLILGRPEKPEFVLVVTHEVSFRAGSLNVLMEALRSYPELAAVGPVLHSTVTRDFAWTASGGTKTRFFGIPTYEKEIPSTDEPVAERAWLDGAAVLYRASALERQRMREEFFLYVEETEFHFRLAKEFGPVACASTAMAFEEANYPPPRVYSRNLQWLFDLHGNRVQRLLSVPYVIFRNIVKVMLGRQTWSGLLELYGGWREARSFPAREESDQVSELP